MYVREPIPTPNDGSTTAAPTSSPIPASPPTPLISPAPLTPIVRFYPSSRPMHHAPTSGHLSITSLAPTLSPACVAALRGDAEELRSLHDAGVDLHTTAYADWAPALLAALNGQTNCLALLVSVGINLYIGTRLGTPLSIARENGHIQAANFILLQDPQWLTRVFNHSLRQLIENGEAPFQYRT